MFEGLVSRCFVRGIFLIVINAETQICSCHCPAPKTPGPKPRKVFIGPRNVQRSQKTTPANPHNPRGKNANNKQRTNTPDKKKGERKPVRKKLFPALGFHPCPMVWSGVAGSPSPSGMVWNVRLPLRYGLYFQALPLPEWYGLDCQALMAPHSLNGMVCVGRLSDSNWYGLDCQSQPFTIPHASEEQGGKE